MQIGFIFSIRSHIVMIIELISGKLPQYVYRCRAMQKMQRREEIVAGICNFQYIGFNRRRGINM